MLRSEQSTMPQDYNATINLPKTDFPMRAGLPKREPEMLQRWKELDVYTSCSRRTRASPASPSTTALPSPTAACTWATP